jgi:hypothetical protein
MEEGQLQTYANWTHSMYPALYINKADPASAWSKCNSLPAATDNEGQPSLGATS